MDKYLISMNGIGKSYHMLIDKDLWNWLECPDKHSWPHRLIDEMWKVLREEHDNRQDMINYYNSVEPDKRAAYLTYLNDIEYFNTIGKLLKHVNYNKVNIVDEIELMIY